MIYKKIGIVTGTRADFGKLKPIIKLLDECGFYNLKIFTTGMHLMIENGSTYREVQKLFPDAYIPIKGQNFGENQFDGLVRFMSNINKNYEFSNIDLLLIHGDRLDVLGVAIAAKMRNIPIIHIEGGELSGSIDERVRHSLTKFADWHMVSNEISKKRVLQLGEQASSVYVTGSPEASILLSESRPSLKEVKERYSINFQNYSMLTFHPVVDAIDENIMLAKLLRKIPSIGQNFILIGSNNDDGYKEIHKAIEEIKDFRNIHYFPNIRFEFYLTLLENSEYVIGNSSSFVREAPIFGVPAIIPGSRQNNRTTEEIVVYTKPNINDVKESISALKTNYDKSNYFGNKDAANNIFNAIKEIASKKTSPNKIFSDVKF